MKIVLKITWIWLRKGQLNRETESLLITAQNNAIITNYIKAKIDNIQNIKCRLCAVRDETVNHIISKTSKRAQKTARLGMTGWEKGSTGNCSNEDKRDIYRPESVLQNEMHKNLWDFGTQTEHSISVKKTKLVLINMRKKNLSYYGVKIKESDKQIPKMRKKKSLMW